MSGERQMVERNVRALRELERQFMRRRTWAQRLADVVTRFLGSIWSAALHGAVFGGWILWNSLPRVPKFDPYPFVMLAMAASVEAIFLTTFVLISQNRMIELQDRREELDLEVDLLAEQQVAHVSKMVDAIASQMGIHEAQGREPHEEARPEKILEALEAAEREPS